MIEDEFDKTMKDIKEHLIDRIKRQEQEIERLNTTIQSNINSYNKLSKYSSDLEDRIDKAIEYIEKSINGGNISNCSKDLIWVNFSTDKIENLDKLLSILKGSDKE